jgi:hypothetical protein
MAIEKGLYGMPEGIDEELVGDMGEPDAMIEMAIATDEDMPVMVELEDGSVEISFGEETGQCIDMAPFDANLAEYLDDKPATRNIWGFRRSHRRGYSSST